MSEFDSPWKEAIDLYFERFLEFCFPIVHRSVDWSRGYESLDQELRQVLREAEIGRRVVDKLVRVWRRDGTETWVMVHVEIQSQYEANFAERMFVYHYRLFDRYGRHPVSLAVLADERPAWKPHEFGYELWGCGLNFWFPTIKLLDYGTQADDLAASSNPFAMVVLAHLQTLQTARDAQVRQSFKSQLVRCLYERGFERRDVLHLFRFIDWMMELPPELERQFREDLVRIEQEKHMPYVTSIERMGIERGAREQALRAIEQGLRIKFGEEGLALLPEIQKLAEVQQLERLLEKLWSAKRIGDLQPIGGTAN